MQSLSTTTTERRHSSTGSDHGPISPRIQSFPVFSDISPISPGSEQSYQQYPRSILANGRVNGSLPAPKWQPRRSSKVSWGANVHGGHDRQRSLGDAIGRIRERKGSFSDQAAEVAEALKVPVSPRLVLLCLVWYLSSALTNTSSKAILNAFAKPVTLTVVQFAFTASWCLVVSYLAFLFPSLQRAIPALQHHIRPMTSDILRTTLPLGLFQLVGHVLSSTATSKIPVSLVHTIKGMSPLFTVLAYRFIYSRRYSASTYLSLIPLTVGVILACSAQFSGNLFGILCALAAALVFVSQNIFSKKLFDRSALASSDSRNLDKLNLLYYSSFLAFLLTFPLWLYSEGFALLEDFLHDYSLDTNPHPSALQPWALAMEFLFNGTFHFGQNIIAFALLSMVSPVTYSVASLIKRIFVIVLAIVWFGSKTSAVQAGGILLTFVGLYIYDRTNDVAKVERRAKMEEEGQDSILPLVQQNGSAKQQPLSGLGPPSSPIYSGHNGFAFGENKRTDELRVGRTRGTSIAA